MSTEEIARHRQAWARQLRGPGLRPMDADRIAHAQAAQPETGPQKPEAAL